MSWGCDIFSNEADLSINLGYVTQLEAQFVSAVFQTLTEARSSLILFRSGGVIELDEGQTMEV